MNKVKRSVAALICCLLTVTAFAQQPAASFKVVPLGVRGGSNESNLSAYMVAAASSNQYVCLDAGTLHYGIQMAINKGIFKGTVNNVLKNRIKGYLISHPHLDHVAGLIINSPDDTAKNIYALPFCEAVLKEKYFSWKSWANFADDGEKPLLKKFHYATLSAAMPMDLAQTNMSVTAYELSHSSPYKSTAFLLKNNDAYLLYLGDTGADSIEHASNLQTLWEQVSPLIKQGQLKAIFIEVSFDNSQPAALLFGHLTPNLLLQELQALEKTAGREVLRKVPIVITHEKPGQQREIRIKKQLLALKPAGMQFIFPSQGTMLQF
ncbi:MAG TPA: 3',5'-cyclic-nucleotide phosphodiesterase [Chitinophagaceae bacterium]|nr:3',5'-cyclic-nucleotide phosphodiesterase [Chitinophagaceae bacterium]